MKKDAKIIGVWGGRGSGKSTRIKEITEKNQRLIVFDPIGDYAKERGFTGYKTLRGLYKAIKQNWNKGFRFVLTVGRGDDAQDMLESLSDGFFIIQKPYFEGKDSRKITLIVEEMAVCYPQTTLGKNNRNFMNLINLGRHYGVEIIGASQRIAEVHKNFVGNAAEHYFFRMGAAVDYDAAARQIGRKYKDEMRGLGTHYFLHSAQGTVKKGKNKCNFKR